MLCKSPGVIRYCPVIWQDAVRMKVTEGLIEKLFNMGLVPTKKSLLQCEKLAVSAFCRRRLPVVLVRLKFCETLKEAVTFVEQGHIRIGAYCHIFHPLDAVSLSYLPVRKLILSLSLSPSPSCTSPFLILSSDFPLALCCWQ